MFYKMLMVVLMVISIVLPKEEPTLGNWRWSEDTLEPTDDKQVHAVGSFGLYYLFVNKGMTQNKAIASVLGLGLFKEGIDALVPWETYGRWGGDGFSENDIVYNVIGVGSAYIIDKLWEKKSYENNAISFEVYPGHIRFNIHFN